MKKKLPLYLFLLVVLGQLYIPFQMIMGHENVLAEGDVFKFKVAPVDPADPLRGKYIDLNFESVRYNLKDTSENWQINEPVFVHLTSDNEGFAAIDSLSIYPPENDLPYVKAHIRHKFPYHNPESIEVAYPFDRFYMEESKAYDAEVLYRESLSDSLSATYALVHVKDGRAVITDVLIDGVPLTELIREKQ